MTYQKHFFICTNQKENGQACGQFNTKEICKNLKQQFRDQGVEGIRINQSGCLGECAKGPVMVVYPECKWYSFFEQQDVQEIIQSHIDTLQTTDTSEQQKILEKIIHLELQ